MVSCFIGQAPPRIPQSIPFERTRLWEWLSWIGISQEQALREFAFTAMAKDYPGSRNGAQLPPTPIAMAEHLPFIMDLIKTEKLRVIVPVGTVALRAVMADRQMRLEDVIGTRLRARPFGAGEREYDIVPIPHPSGASPWVWLPGNRERLEETLRILQQFIT